MSIYLLFDSQTLEQNQVSYVARKKNVQGKNWQVHTFYLLFDKSLPNFYKQCIRWTKKICAAPPRISINSIPEAENIM